MKKVILFLLLLQALQCPAQTKKVLLEEFTTNLCGFCPPRSHDIQVYYENHTASSVFMTHHAGFGTDSMTNASASTFASYFQPSTFGFAPAIMIDRDVYTGVDTVPYMIVSGFDTIADRVSGNTTETDIQFSGSYDAVSRILNLTTTVTFNQSLASGSRSISLFLIEDSVIGSGTGWDQKCYDAGFANQYYPGQYNAGTTYISQYPHRNVQRVALAGTWGNATTIPTTPMAATPYSLNTIYSVPAAFNVNRLKVVGIVANNGNNKFAKKVLNVNDVPVSTFTTTGLSETPALTNVYLYPNPAYDVCTLQFENTVAGEITIELFDLSGKLIKLFDKGTMLPAGFYSADLNISEYKKGIYQLIVKSGKALSAQKLVITE
ncbi:MAG: Omp28-related outer membrane protein [Bacteroidia bacterium]